MQRIFANTIFIFLFSVSLLVSAAHCDISDDGSSEEINMIRGELRPIGINNLTRISIADPDIVDIADIEDENVLLIAKDIGITAVFIWEEDVKRTVMINVSAQDLENIRGRVTNLLKMADIKGVTASVNKKEAKVVLHGDVEKDKLPLFDDILLQYDENVINLTQEERLEDLIQVDMRVAELNTSLSKQLGIDWTNDPDGEVLPFQLQYDESFPELDGSLKDLVKFGQFSRTSALAIKVNALIEEGKGRILSEPKLVVKGGEEASFLVGGEIPVTTTTTSDGAVSEEVQYKKYGIGMTITPEVRNETQIDIMLDIEISDIDSSNSVGSDVAFITRTASTNLILENGETNILAGLIRNQSSESLRKIPYMHKIPVLGALFRSKRNPTPNTDQELVISMTPKILAYSKKKQGRMAAKNNSKEKNILSTRKSKAYRSARPYYPGIPKEMFDYVREVQAKILSGADYPKEAEIYGWEGTVKLDLLILQDGTLAFAIIKESSGQELFDEYAVAAAKNNAPFGGFPSGTDLQELSVTIPIVYSLNNY